MESDCARCVYIVLHPSPLSVILNGAHTVQAKLICSYNASKNVQHMSEGQPIISSEGWGPQQRLGLNTDTNIPCEIEANAYTRDSITESILGAKQVEHKPVVYTLPKNTTLEPQQKLESIIDIGSLQVGFGVARCVFHCRCVPVTFRNLF